MVGGRPDGLGREFLPARIRRERPFRCVFLPLIGRRRIVGLAIAILGFAHSFAGADTIYIKGDEGQTIEGVIDQERSDENRVFIRTDVGLMPIARARIDRIEVRENISAKERQGDLALQRGEFDEALEFYLVAYEQAPEEKALERKIADTKDRIEAEKRLRYAPDFEEIDESIRRREFAEAIAKAQRLVDEAPDDASRAYVNRKLAQTHLAQAREYENMVNYDDAESAYRKAIESSPQSALPQLELAELVSQSPSRRDEAFALYREGLTYASKDPTLVDQEDLVRHRFSEAQLYFRESLHREAADLLWAVVQIDEEGNYPRADEMLVRALASIRSELIEENEENNRALEILESLVEIQPSHSNAHYLLGKVYCEREAWEEAIPHLDRAVDGLIGPNASSDRAEARHCLARSYRSTGQLQDAVVQLQALLVDQPTRYDARCELGEILGEQLEFQKALAQFNRAIRIDSGIYRAYLGAARMQRALKRFDDALENYNKLIELRDGHAAYLYELGLTYADLNQPDKARDYYVQASQLIEEKEGETPTKESRVILAKAYTQIGIGSLAERNYYEAIQKFDQALENEEGLAEAYDGKGQALRELGKLDEAEKLFRRALAEEPENPKFLLNLGIFYHKYKKDRKGALDFYMKYFEFGGTDPQVRDWIRECGGTPPRIS